MMIEIHEKSFHRIPAFMNRFANSKDFKEYKKRFMDMSLTDEAIETIKKKEQKKKEKKEKKKGKSKKK